MTTQTRRNLPPLNRFFAKFGTQTRRLQIMSARHKPPSHKPQQCVHNANPLQTIYSLNLGCKQHKPPQTYLSPANRLFTNLGMQTTAMHNANRTQTERKPYSKPPSLPQTVYYANLGHYEKTWSVVELLVTLNLSAQKTF
jgi:hypothetical protein